MENQLDLFHPEEEPAEASADYTEQEAPYLIVLEPREHYDIAILGVLDGTEKCVYDAQRVVEITAEIHGMDYEEALEFYEYNIAGSKGENYPEYVWLDDFFSSKEAKEANELEKLKDSL